jgi:Nif-specific regulatory protein
MIRVEPGISMTTNAKWMDWHQLPWLSRTDEAAATVQFCDRLLQSSLAATSRNRFLQETLPVIATEFSVQWAALQRRSPQWETCVECGRHLPNELPFRFLEEALDREASGITRLEHSESWSLIAVPLPDETVHGSLLLLAGQQLEETMLPAALVVARALSFSVGFVEKQERNVRRIERLHDTLEIASSLAKVHESQPLLELIAQEATRLLDCDRASIFIWDRENNQLVACPALGVDGGTLRLPDTLGLVGEVIRHGETARIDNAYEDPRFDKSVDDSSGYTTRNLLCAPLNDNEGKVIGAFEVINKNEGAFSDDDEETVALLGRQAAIAIQNTREREELVRSHEQLTEQVTREMQIIGENPAVAALRGTIERLAGTDLPVLILGESGTGKEVVAQALHFQGPRASQPFVAINCAALTETLLESELFGHEKGAFTDAHESRPGKFELATGGTLFLDEIGDMSLGGQAKLLRVLEQKVITRVGGAQPIPINVRVVAATNKNLTEAVRERKFREDLYYRLSVVTQPIPPLRERPEDILLLAEHFLKTFSVQAGRRTLKISGDARRRLQAHAWPGNVRELRNLMERVAFLCTGERVDADDLAFILSPDVGTAIEPSEDMDLGEATRRFQQDFIRRSIKRVKGNMSEAARLLGVHRSNLYRKMRQLEMSEVGGEE